MIVLGLAACLAFVYLLAYLPAADTCGEICLP